MDESALTAVSASLAEQGSHLPFATETVVLSKLEYIELKSQLNFYKAQHARVLAREAALKQQLAQQEAKVRDLNQRLYGRKSEQTKRRETGSQAPSTTTPARPVTTDPDCVPGASPVDIDLVPECGTSITAPQSRSTIVPSSCTRMLPAWGSACMKPSTIIIRR